MNMSASQVTAMLHLFCIGGLWLLVFFVKCGCVFGGLYTMNFNTLTR